MKYIQGTNRHQLLLFPESLDSAISEDNEVRLIDLFVDSLDLEKFGFKLDFVEEGRPAYHPSDLLKLFIYGYLNKIRSSRDLEKECKRNIEVIWLLKSLQPDHNTISNFRRDNPKAIKKVFRATVQIAKHFDLIGGTLIAGDSTKFRAQNSKKNNFNQAKIDRHLDYIDNKLNDYYSSLDSADDDNKSIIQNEINTQLLRKQNYLDIQDQLLASGQPQISTSDPDSRQLIIRNNITETAYNVQTSNDAKHNLIFDFKVTNQNDSKAMGNMIRRAKSIIRSNNFTALYDKGYHTGSELKIAQELGIQTIVAVPDIPSSSFAPDPAFNVSKFTYNSVSDSYSCPMGNTLSSNGNWYAKSQRNNIIKVKHYKTSKCKSCPALNSCTKNTKNRGRVVERSEFADYYEKNKFNVLTKQHLYKRRQTIVEHPYGTIKRQWGFSYILTKKGIHRASADVGLMFIAYNLRRLISILGQKVLKKYFKVILSYFFAISLSIQHYIKNSIFFRFFKNRKQKFSYSRFYPLFLN